MLQKNITINGGGGDFKKGIIASVGIISYAKAIVGFVRESKVPGQD